MQDVTDSFVHRHARTEAEDEERDDEAPEIELTSMTERVVRVGRPRRSPETVKEQQLISGVDEGMHRLAHHRGAAGDLGGGELRQGDEEIPHEGGTDDARGFAARHGGTSGECREYTAAPTLGPRA